MGNWDKPDAAGGGTYAKNVSLFRATDRELPGGQTVYVSDPRRTTAEVLADIPERAGFMIGTGLVSIVLLGCGIHQCCSTKSCCNTTCCNKPAPASKRTGGFGTFAGGIATGAGAVALSVKGEGRHWCGVWGDQRIHLFRGKG